MTTATMQISRKHTGHYRYGWYLWELITDLDLKLDDIAEIQSKEGYPPNPYGLYSPKKIQRSYKSGKKEFKYTWKCSTTSD